VIPLLRVLHFYCTMQDATLRKPSLQGALRAFNSIGQLHGGLASPGAQTPLGQRSLQEYWSKFQRARPFLYAAHLTIVNENQTFLEFLAKKGLGQALNEKKLLELFGRARFLRECIFDHLPNHTVWDVSFPLAVKCIPIASPPEHERHAELIRSSFSHVS